MKPHRFALACLWLAAAAGPAVAADAERYAVSLADCYAQTLERNPDIRRQRADLARAAGTKIVFTARAMPRLTAQGQGGMSGGSLYDSGGPFAVARADISQPLFDMGLLASVRRGKLEVVIAQQELHRAVTDQLHATRLAFVEALLCRQLLDLHRQIETHLEANLRAARQRFELGAASKQAVQQAEIQLLNLKPELVKTQGRHFDAVTRLAERTGQPVAERGRVRLPEPSGSLEYALPAVDLEKESARTLRRRPDLVLLREAIAAAAEDKRMVQAGYYPLVSLVALSQYVPKDEVFLRRPEIVSGQESRSTETRFGVSMTWQMIDNGRVTGASRRVESGRQTLEIALRRLEENVPRELAVVARTLETVDARLAALKQSAAQAQEVLKLAESRVALGEATQLDFLNAQNNLLTTRAGLLQAVFENEAARAEFDRLTGRYLDIGSTDRK